jgi:hypothetical protein
MEPLTVAEVVSFAKSRSADSIGKKYADLVGYKNRNETIKKTVKKAAGDLTVVNGDNRGRDNRGQPLIPANNLWLPATPSDFSRPDPSKHADAASSLAPLVMQGAPLKILRLIICN